MPHLRSSRRTPVALLVLALVLAGCSRLPIQEVSDARQALDSARAAGGEHYTPQALEQAQQLIDQALRDLAAGDYHAARAAALTAKQRAIYAREASLAVQLAN